MHSLLKRFVCMKGCVTYERSDTYVCVVACGCAASSTMRERRREWYFHSDVSC